MSFPYLDGSDKGVFLAIYVVPGASRSAFVGEYDGMLKVQIAAPPVDGKANKAIRAFVAKTLGLKKGDIDIASGKTSKRKRLLLSGAALDEIAQTLDDLGVDQ